MGVFGLTAVNQNLNHMNRIDLEERLINFAVLIFKVTNNLPKTKTGYYFSDQIMRSASSSALNFGEAQSAESKKDFIHKIKSF
jgi:four helix bundle protein